MTQKTIYYFYCFYYRSWEQKAQLKIQFNKSHFPSLIHSLMTITLSIHVIDSILGIFGLPWFNSLPFPFPGYTVCPPSLVLTRTGSAVPPSPNKWSETNVSQEELNQNFKSIIHFDDKTRNWKLKIRFQQKMFSPLFFPV